MTSSEHTSFHLVDRLLQDEFPHNISEVKDCVYRGRCSRKGDRPTAADGRFEPYAVACLWLGGQVVAAAALRLNLPPAASASSSCAADAHLQVVLQATASGLQRRGLGRLLTQCIMRTAAKEGHQYITVLVSDQSTTQFWARVGFRSPPPRNTTRLPLALHKALEQSREQSLFGDVSVWYAGLSAAGGDGSGDEEDTEEAEEAAVVEMERLVCEAAARVAAAFIAAAAIPAGPNNATAHRAAQQLTTSHSRPAAAAGSADSDADGGDSEAERSEQRPLSARKAELDRMRHWPRTNVDRGVEASEQQGEASADVEASEQDEGDHSGDDGSSSSSSSGFDGSDGGSGGGGESSGDWDGSELQDAEQAVESAKEEEEEEEEEESEKEEEEEEEEAEVVKEEGEPGSKAGGAVGPCEVRLSKFTATLSGPIYMRRSLVAALLGPAAAAAAQQCHGGLPAADAAAMALYDATTRQVIAGRARLRPKVVRNGLDAAWEVLGLGRWLRGRDAADGDRLAFSSSRRGGGGGSGSSEAGDGGGDAGSGGSDDEEEHDGGDSAAAAGTLPRVYVRLARRGLRAPVGGAAADGQQQLARGSTTATRKTRENQEQEQEQQRSTSEAAAEVEDMESDEMHDQDEELAEELAKGTATAVTADRGIKGSRNGCDGKAAHPLRLPPPLPRPPAAQVAPAAPLPPHPPGSVSFCLVSCNRAGACELSRAAARAGFPIEAEAATRAFEARRYVGPGGRAKQEVEAAGAAAVPAAPDRDTLFSCSRDVELYFRSAHIAGGEIRPYAGARLTCYSQQRYGLTGLKPLRQELAVSIKAPLRLTVLPCGRAVVEVAAAEAAAADAAGAEGMAAREAVLQLTQTFASFKTNQYAMRYRLVELLLGPDMARSGRVTAVPLYDSVTRERIAGGARLMISGSKRGVRSKAVAAAAEAAASGGSGAAAKGPPPRWQVAALGLWMRAWGAQEGDRLAFTAEPNNDDPRGVPRVYLEFRRQHAADGDGSGEQGIAEGADDADVQPRSEACLVTVAPKAQLNWVPVREVVELLGQEVAASGVLPGTSGLVALPLRVPPHERQWAPSAVFRCDGMRPAEVTPRWQVVGLTRWLTHVGAGPGSRLLLRAVREPPALPGAPAGAVVGGGSSGSAAPAGRVVAVEVRVEAAVPWGDAEATGGTGLRKRPMAQAAGPDHQQQQQQQQQPGAGGGAKAAAQTTAAGWGLGCAQAQAGAEHGVAALSGNGATAPPPAKRSKLPEGTAGPDPVAQGRLPINAQQLPKAQTQLRLHQPVDAKEGVQRGPGRRRRHSSSESPERAKCVTRLTDAYEFDDLFQTPVATRPRAPPAPAAPKAAPGPGAAAAKAGGGGACTPTSQQVAVKREAQLQGGALGPATGGSSRWEAAEQLPSPPAPTVVTPSAQPQQHSHSHSLSAPGGGGGWHHISAGPSPATGRPVQPPLPHPSPPAAHEALAMRSGSQNTRGLAVPGGPAAVSSSRHQRRSRERVLAPEGQVQTPIIGSRDPVTAAADVAAATARRDGAAEHSGQPPPSGYIRAEGQEDLPLSGRHTQLRGQAESHGAAQQRKSRWDQVASQPAERAQPPQPPLAPPSPAPSGPPMLPQPKAQDPGRAGTRGSGATGRTITPAGSAVQGSGLEASAAAAAAAEGGGVGPPPLSGAASAAQLREALAEYYPKFFKLMLAIWRQQQQQQQQQHQPQGRLREVLPLQVLQHYARQTGWQYEVEFERQHVGSSVCAPPLAAGDGNSSAAAAGACVVYVATVQLSCSDVDTVIATPGKVAADKETARQLAAAACLQQLLATGVSPSLMWPQQSPPALQHPVLQPPQFQLPPTQQQSPRPMMAVPVPYSASAADAIPLCRGGYSGGPAYLAVEASAAAAAAFDNMAPGSNHGGITGDQACRVPGMPRFQAPGGPGASQQHQHQHQHQRHVGGMPDSGRRPCQQPAVTRYYHDAQCRELGGGAGGPGGGSGGADSSISGRFAASCDAYLDSGMRRPPPRQAGRFNAGGSSTGQRQPVHSHYYNSSHMERPQPRMPQHMRPSQPSAGMGGRVGSDMRQQAQPMAPMAHPSSAGPLNKNASIGPWEGQGLPFF
ncbi:hypothetical protein HYH02_010153 [Chlamydomonas schloesseri]|uniref:N-acetyltransferase domain-containing protein n=1 Tax=Chlamydomonas schloesseri TaxID=2026947 RepID=A0A835TMS3_9CHLO|nr:hypothetical protein HYH02_010153 [Chlamydomonas schloesseri]|eukprot:KAG2440570.1 hypothetical protein HYH02_010153 [Chlamydomonas schloesseri]